MRTTYEAKLDVTNEKAVQAEIEKRWSCNLHKMPKAQHIDWVATRGKQATAFIELKCRTNKRHQYPTLMLSFSKWMHGIQMASAAAIPFLLVIRWLDGTYYLKVTDSTPMRVEHGGRQDRGDWQDMEPVVQIDINLFRPL